MKTVMDIREPIPTSYDRSGQMMVELWPERPAFQVACPECGAPMHNGLACREIYEELLNLESSDPDGAGSVHSLSVVCYVLQHPRGYSDAALTWGLNSLKEILKNGRPRSNSPPSRRGIFDFFKRKLTAGPAIRPAAPTRWQMTIDQVYRSDSLGHPERVRRWAWTILTDLEGGSL